MHRFIRITTILALAVFALFLMVVSNAFAQGTMQTLYTFKGGPNDGANPFGTPIFDSAGNLYGTTLAGGQTYWAGAVWQLTNTNGTWSESIIHSFGSTNDGAQVEAGLTMGKGGHLYGATCFGGTTGNGTVFELVPSNGTWTENILYEFKGGSDGICPYLGHLTLDRKGNLYGTAKAGGAYNAGIVFQLKPHGKKWTETILHTFTGGSDAAWPNESLVFDNAGNLYGASFQGGGSGCGGWGCGTVFQLTRVKKQWQERVLYAFTGGADGSQPYESVILDSQGNLYGTTFGGGDASGHGVVYKLTPAGGAWNHTVLYTFSGTEDGANPYVNVTLGKDGALYGATDQAGANLNGVLFKLTPTGQQWTYSTLYAFTGGWDGGLPLSGLTFDQAGNIYGVTVQGGDPSCYGMGCGAIYKFTP